jgi:hypothetical protein
MHTPDPSYALMLERIELTKERDARDEIAKWRHATDEERSRAIAELADFAEKVIRSRGFPDERPPLAYPRLPNVAV